MTSPSEPRTQGVYHRRPGPGGAASAFTPLGGVALLLAGMATLIVVAVATEGLGAPGLVGLSLGELGLVAVPVIATLHARFPLASLGLRRAIAARYAISGALVGSALWYLNWQTVVAFDISDERVQVLAEAIARPPLPLALVALAVLPAICEEVLFRGVVLRAFAGAYAAPVAVIASAALFSAYHLSLPQALPTFTLGLALGALALRAGSVYPTMIAHFMNNLFPVLVTRPDLEQPRGWISDHPLIALIGSSALVITGVAVMLAPPPLEPVVATGKRGP
jgi:membrane protease YdiL (CAAX protease family)